MYDLRLGHDSSSTCIVPYRWKLDLHKHSQSDGTIHHESLENSETDMKLILVLLTVNKFLYTYSDTSKVDYGLIGDFVLLQDEMSEFRYVVACIALSCYVEVAGLILREPLQPVYQKGI